MIISLKMFCVSRTDRNKETNKTKNNTKENITKPLPLPPSKKEKAIIRKQNKTENTK